MQVDPESENNQNVTNKDDSLSLQQAFNIEGKSKSNVVLGSNQVSPLEEINNNVVSGDTNMHSQRSKKSESQSVEREETVNKPAPDPNVDDAVEEEIFNEFYWQFQKILSDHNLHEKDLNKLAKGKQLNDMMMSFWDKKENTKPLFKFDFKKHHQPFRQILRNVHLKLSDISRFVGMYTNLADKKDDEFHEHRTFVSFEDLKEFFRVNKKDQDEDSDEENRWKHSYLCEPLEQPKEYPITMNQLMENKKYRLESSHMLANISRIQMDKIYCKVCTKEIPKYVERAWTSNKKSFTCFKCFPDDYEWDKLIKQINADPESYPVFFSNDSCRMKSVLNNNKGCLRYLNSAGQMGAHLNAFQKPWQLELTNQKRVISTQNNKEHMKPVPWMEKFEEENIITFPPYKNVFALKVKKRDYAEWEQINKAGGVQKEKEKPKKKYEPYVRLYFVDFGENNEKMFTRNKKDIYCFKVLKSDLKALLVFRGLDPNQFIHPDLEYDQKSEKIIFGEKGFRPKKSLYNSFKIKMKTLREKFNPQKIMQTMELVKQKTILQQQKESSKVTSPISPLKTSLDTDKDFENKIEKENQQEPEINSSHHESNFSEDKEGQQEKDSLIQKEGGFADFNKTFNTRLDQLKNKLQLGTKINGNNEHFREELDQLLQECVNELVHKIEECRVGELNAEQNCAEQDPSQKEEETKKPLVHNHLTEPKGYLEMSVAPYKPGSQTWFFPASEVYVIDNEAIQQRNQKNIQEDLTKRIYKQKFIICFRIQQEILEVFDLEIKWTYKNPVSMNIVNKKWLINLDPRSVAPNFLKDGQIDGFTVMDANTYSWIKFKSTKSYQYAFQNNFMFATYKQFTTQSKKQSEEKKPISQRESQQDNKEDSNSDISSVNQSESDSEYCSSDDDNKESSDNLSEFYETQKEDKRRHHSQPVQFLMLECQLTEPSIENIDQFGQLHMLRNGIRCLLNMVPGHISQHDLEKKINWLQPLEILGGRSTLQLFIGNKNIRNNLELEHLNVTYRNTVFKNFARQLKKTQNYEKESALMLIEIIEPLLVGKREMCPDLMYRNAIHDCLDFDNPLLNKDSLTIMVKHLGELPVDSQVTKEIFQGLLPRFLNENCIIPEFSNFFQDAEGQMISKFVTEVHFTGIPQSSREKLHVEFNINTEKLKPLEHMKEKILEVNSKINANNEINTYPVQHFYIDFRHAFFQANFQCMIDFFDLSCRKKNYKKFLSDHGEEESKELHTDFHEGEIEKFREHEYHQIYEVFFNRNGFKNNYEKAKFIVQINQLYGDDVETHTFLKLVMMEQFMVTQVYTGIQAVIYISFYFLPYVFQLYHSHRNEHTRVILLNILCLIDLVAFAVLEYEQLKVKGGFKKYIQEQQNIFDFIHITLFFVYFWLRIGHPQDIIPNLKNLEFQDGYGEQGLSMRIFWVMINSALMGLAVLKLMVFARSMPKFQRLVQLIGYVLAEIIHFLFFFMFWIIINVLLFELAGVEITERTQDGPDPDYPYVNKLMAQILQNFRNSLGDIKPPTYQYWTVKHQTNVGNHMSFSQNFMIGYAWFLFMMNEIFMLIVLLNFLIAIISESYENVMSTQEVSMYQSMCQLNLDAAILDDALKKWFNVDILRENLNKFRLKTHSDYLNEQSKMWYIVTTNESGDKDQTFYGFVKTIKKYIKYSNVKLRDELTHNIRINNKQLENTLDRVIKELDRKLMEQLKDIKVQNKSMKKSIREMIKYRVYTSSSEEEDDFLSTNDIQPTKEKKGKFSKRK